MMGESQVAAFRRLDHPQPAIALSEALGKTPSSVSKLVHALESQGLVTRASEKNAPIIRSTTPHANVLGELLAQYPRLAWERLLSHGGLVILAWMTTKRGEDTEIESPVARSLATFEHKPRTIEQLAHATGFQRSYVHRRVMEFAKAGVVVRAERGYALNAQHAKLREFVRWYWIHQNYQEQRRDAPEARILWQRGPEFLLQDKHMPIAPGYQSTSLSMMAKMGMPLTTRTVLAYRTERALTVADHIVHTFLAAPTSSSNVAYACLHYAKARPKDLPEVGDLYDVGVPMRLLVQFVESRGGISGRPFPAWSEFEDLARDYGVSL